MEIILEKYWLISFAACPAYVTATEFPLLMWWVYPRDLHAMAWSRPLSIWELPEILRSYIDCTYSHSNHKRFRRVLSMHELLFAVSEKEVAGKGNDLTRSADGSKLDPLLNLRRRECCASICSHTRWNFQVSGASGKTVPYIITWLTSICIWSF